MSAGNSSSGPAGGSVMGEGVTAAGGVSALPLVTPFITGTGAALESGLIRVFSGTFSFCAVVSTELVPSAAVPPNIVDTDAGESVGFFVFFFLLDLVEG